MMKRGFTLIELMLATMLTAMLMVGVLMVITSLRKPMPALDGEGEASAVGDLGAAALDVIAADLSQALRVQAVGGGLELMSYGGLDPATRRRTQRPVRVSYRVHDVSGVPWLVRQEQSLDTQTNLPPRRELVVSGYDRVELLPPSATKPGERREPQRAGAGRDDDAASSDGNDRPPRVEGLWRLRLWQPGGEAPAAERLLVLRRDLEPPEEVSDAE